MNVRVSGYAVLLAAAMIFFVSSGASAQDAGEQTPRDRAMALFDQGRRQINEGDERAGLASCEEAYGIYPTPAALARLGACYEWAGKTDDAVDAYRRAFSSSAADDSVREFSASAIERLTGERPVAPPPDTEDEGDEEEEEEDVDGARPEPIAPPRDESSTVLPWAFTIGSFVLAAGAAVAGGMTYALWSDLDDQAAQLRAIRATHAPPYDEPEYAAAYADIEDRNPDLETLSTVTLVLGGAALVAGAVAVILWLTSD